VGQEAFTATEAPAIWEGLADNVVTVTKRDWSEAYGLFLEGEAGTSVLSYTTSPAYHLDRRRRRDQSRRRL